MSGFDLSSYTQVKDRIPMFWAAYPDGRIDCDPPQIVQIDGRWFISSTVAIYKHRDHPLPDTTGTAWEPFPGRTPYTKDSEAMNAETSAIGRALGALGIGIAGSVATADEVRNRNAEREPLDANQAIELRKDIAGLGDTGKQRLKDEWKKRRIPPLEKLTVGDLPAVEKLIADIANTTEPAEPKTPEQKLMPRLFALLNEHGIDDDSRHTWAADQLGRDVTSFNDLDDDDVHRLIELLTGPVKEPA